MSSSTDSLKKKVCVTVFLDELFEEVEEMGEKEEKEEEEERRERKQVSEVAESVTKMGEKPFRESSRVDVGNEERVKVSPSADAERSQIEVRPRKHRRESKFSKNRYDSFKKELSKYGYGSCVKVENEGREAVDSAVSDSDFDLDEFLGLDKWVLEKSRSSLSEVSECDLTEESFLSVDPAPAPAPALSSIVISCPKDKTHCQNQSGAYMESSVLYCNKSTQFEGADGEDKSSDGRVGDEISFEKEGKKVEEDVLAWKKTQRQIQLIMSEAKNRYQEKETCEGDRIRCYDLRSILEECVKADGSIPVARSNASTDLNESDVQELSDSYTYVFPHSKQSLQNRAPEVKRVWASAKRNLWNDGFDSDLSEADCCAQYAKEVGLRSIQNDSLLCYTLSLKCKENEWSEKVGQTGRNDRDGEKKLEQSASLPNKKRSSCGQLSLESMKSRTSREASLVVQAVAHLADGTILGTMLKTEQEKSERGNEGRLSGETGRGSPPPVEGRSKNFAEGDAMAKPLPRDSKFLLDLEAKEKLLVCDEILSHVGEAKVIRNEIIVNRAEIELHPQAAVQERAEMPSLPSQTTAAPDVLAEVFFNQKRSESLEKSMTDDESEMVFAESENFCESDEFFCGKYAVGPAPSLMVQGNPPKKDVCVVEFEDKLSRSKILRRMKTVEILGNSSLNDMKNISTEVILICENISNNEVCMEAWQSSTSTLKSISEIKQCYLKDSKDSAMYLIEIPLHFTHAKKEKPSVSENFFKPSDSD